MDFNNKINAMALICAVNLGLKICHINIVNQKIDGSIIKTFEIVWVNFQVEDKLGRA